MEDAALPDEVYGFIVQKVDSIAHLEALLLLFDKPDLGWDSEAVARRLYIGGQSAGAILERLRTLGLAVTDGAAYRFAAGSAGLDAQVRQVADYYATHLIAVTALIHSKPANRIQEFARAFVIRKDP